MKLWVLAVCRFAYGYTELAFVWTGILTWEWLTKTHLSADVKSSLYAGGFISISFWNWHKATARAEAAETAVAKRETPPHVFAEEPEALTAHLRDPKLLSRMQVVTYLEKWIVVTGTVEGAGGTDLVIAPQRGSRVSLHFPAESQSSDVRIGQPLTAVCQIKPSFAQPWVSLENCELVRTGRKVATLARAS